MFGWKRNFLTCLALLAACTTTGGSSISEDEATSLIRRHLEDGGSNSYFEYDLSEFSLRFDRCQYVKMFDDEMAEDEDSDSPLVIKHFAVFRLCPSDDCESCSGTYGRYVSEIGDYLQSTAEEQEEAFEYMCGNCQERCNEDGEYCSGCGKLCYRYEHLEENGYVDAADYIECQKVEMNNDDDDEDDENEDDDYLQLYIGPRCSQDGNRILIGLFSDEYCLYPYTEADPVDYLGANISYHSLAHTYNNDGSVCLSCKESDADANEDDEQDADDVNEMCEGVYNNAAKCESKFGLNGFIQMNNEDGDYENQIENEFMACNFIESLLWNSYTETGDINVDGDQDVILRDITSLQKTAVSLLSLSIVGLLTAAYFTQRKIDTSYPKVDLACQSDAQIT
jgi:hypothetical protein